MRTHIRKKDAQLGRVYRNLHSSEVVTELHTEEEGSGAYLEMRPRPDSSAFILSESGIFVEVEFNLSEDCCWVPSNKTITPHEYIVEVGKIE